MTLIEADWTRTFVILSTELFVVILFLFLSYKILKRRTDRLTLFFSSFFLSIGIGFIINIIYLLLRVNPIVYLLHTTTLFLLLFGPVFLILFTIDLVKEDKYMIKKYSLLKDSLIITSYVFIIFIIIFFSNGITINEETNWRPVWSWNFLILLYFYLTLFILLPFAYFSIRMYFKIEDIKLRRRWLLFFIGFFGMGFSIYGLILYNTWNNLTFKIIWSVLGLTICSISGVLIYYGIIHNL